MGSHDFRPRLIEPDEMVQVPKSVLKGLFKTPFAAHRQRAKTRGIEFTLTFEQWFDVWWKSGRLLERGIRRDQYVMGRFGDEGPYAVGNVSIITQGQNTSDAHSWFGRNHTTEARSKISVARKLRLRKEPVDVPRQFYNAREYPL